MADRLIQTTDVVPPRDRWSFWKDEVLPTVDCLRLDAGVPFAASRSLTPLAAGTIVDTASGPLSVHRAAWQIARDDRDEVSLMVFVDGHGIADQRDEGGYPLAMGDVALFDFARPFKATALTPYRELRLYVPRAVFAARVGLIDNLMDLRIPAAEPLTALFTHYLQGLCDVLPILSREQADAGLDGALHLLSGLVASRTDLRHDEGEQASGAAVLSLADSHIAAMLGDPNLDVASLARAVGVSRTRLYRAYAERGGVAAEIRNARLDRARQLLRSPDQRRASLEQIARQCGFTDYPTFVRAFRRRFELSPRDARTC